MKIVGLAVAVLLACGCGSKNNQVPTIAELPALVARYEAFITKVAEVTSAGDCAEKGSALGPLFLMQGETDAKMRSAMADPALKAELERLIEARGPKISDPEIAFARVKHDCAGQPGFPSYDK